MNIWIRLAEEGRFDVIAKLRRVELEEEGFGSIVVPLEGFSDNDDIHNEVLKWLDSKGVNVVNTGLEIARLEMALRGNHVTL